MYGVLFYDSNFKYFVNKIATPRNINSYGAGIYFTYIKNDKYTYLCKP